MTQPPPPVTYSVGGNVSGLSSSGLALRYNGGAPQPISRNGAFTSAQSIAAGTMYAVAIATQPTNPAQTCTVSNGSGSIVAANITSIRVSCSPETLAYVVTQGDSSVPPGVVGTISVYLIDPSGALTPVPGSSVTTGPAVTSFQFIPHASFAWALNYGPGGSGIYDYTVDPTTGALTAVAGNAFLTLNGTASTPPACPQEPAGAGLAVAETFHPSGKFGYATITGDNPGVWTFTFDPITGAPLGLGSSAPGICFASSAALDPGGRFAYLIGSVMEPVNVAAPALYAYTIDNTTGALTLVPGGPWLLGGFSGFTIDPTGRFAYQLGAGITAFAIDSSSGAPTAAGDYPLPNFGQGPTSMAIEPSGHFAYVSTSNGSVVAASPVGIDTYSIDAATGALSLVGTLVALQIPSNGTLQIDPSGRFLYISATVAAGQQGIYAYAINAGTGALTLVAGSPFAVGSAPEYPAVVAITN
jgi:6-phosphogluconolactonase (cycloisomerase 2 family)